MRILFFLFAFLLSSAAFAGPAECFDEAVSKERINVDTAILLCRGARSNGPVDCFRAFKNYGYNLYARWSDDQVSGLCAGAEDSGPADCANKVKDVLNVEKSAQLCGAASS